MLLISFNKATFDNVLKNEERGVSYTSPERETRFLSARQGYDKPDMEKSSSPADRIPIRQDNKASTDTDMRGDVMSSKPNTISSS